MLAPPNTGSSDMDDSLPSRWIRPEIRALKAYHVPDARGLIKLDAMENPYPLPEELRQPWLEVLRQAELNRYPDPRAEALTARLRETMGVPAGSALVLGNGSDELIQILAMAMAGPERSLVTVEPGFAMYRMIATFCGLDYHGVSLREDFSLDLEATLAAIARHRPALVFLAYPNNPSGNLFQREAMRRIIEASPGLVVIDEAYHAFAEESWLGEVGEYPNLVVMRTLSKMGLAGLRLGFMAGPPAWLNEFDKLRLPYNINVLTQLSAEFALRHGEVFERQTRLLRQQREHLLSALAAMAGVEPYPSRANFILFRVPSGQAGAVFEQLRQAGILIKKLDGAGPLLKDCLRVTVGTEQENAAFLRALETIMTGRAAARAGGM